jgi:uncharacterized protein YggE
MSNARGKEIVMKRALGISLCLVILFGSVGWSQTKETVRTISVSGSVEWEIAPDQIVWTVSLTDADKDLSAAKDKSDANVKSVLALQKKLDIKEGDIETGYINVRKVYERDKYNNPEEFKHFSVSRNVVIRQRDLDRFDEFFGTLIASADMEVSFKFESSQLQETMADMRLKALQVAMDKAEAMAEVVGAQLGKIVVIDERAPNRRAPNPFNATYDLSAPARDMVSDTFIPGAIKQSVTVYTVFELQ